MEKAPPQHPGITCKHVSDVSVCWRDLEFFFFREIRFCYDIRPYYYPYGLSSSGNTVSGRLKRAPSISGLALR